MASMSNHMKITNGDINYGDTSLGLGRVFYLPHSCDEWVIGNLKDAEKFAEDLLKTIEEVKKAKSQ
jgi:hypothetical protein